MSFWYTKTAANIMKGALNLDAGGDDIRTILVMTNTTADTERDKATISAFTDLDEADGASYARVAMLNEAVQEDAANDRGEFHTDDVPFPNLGVGTRQTAGMIIYKHVTDDTDSIPIAYIDTGGFPATHNGQTFTVKKNVEGWLHSAA